ncbi:LacI family DNA-binding transcriptional regulator [Erwinia sp. S43]|uniref:LacI family DNA-binding transcriptional regulator n=1 Tax=Erwinia sp. S43 TaxID=2769339 RepID=UPI00190B6C5A|nr:LacI family DNA-binding transcriptional regulator [Erwinia sp. S43]MBK0033161.1 LacI family DNA-binding transcriptional regulator [Erwinia sp. S43]
MSLKDIASALGLSVTTISRALNGYDDVAEETRLRIQQEAQRRGYRPNPVARSLKTGKTNALGLLFPSSPLPFNGTSFVDVIGAIAQALAEREVDLLIFADTPENDHRSLQRMLRSRYVSGLIVAHTVRHDSRLAKLQQLNFPFLALGRSELKEPYAWFDFDHHTGPRLAVDHYAAQGLHRIAWLGSHLDQAFVSQRREGYLSAMQRHGFDSDLCWQAEPSRLEGYRTTRQLLALPQPPQALIADSSSLGEGAAIALREMGRLSGPERIELMIYNGLPTDSVIDVPVASIAQATWPAIGQQVAEMALRLMAGEPVSSLQELWQPELKIP